MISKKNSAFIFEPKIFVKNTYTDQNLSFPFKKHEIFGGVAHVYGAKTNFHMTTCGYFFRTLRRSKDVIFHEKIFAKFCLTCSENNLFYI